jgi:hypothetical protein
MDELLSAHQVLKRSRREMATPVADQEKQIRRQQGA